MTKIDIISGFLGAGKTTLIKKLIKDALAGTRVVLIENEFGEIGIDGGFLKEAGIEIREMNSGCICCSLVGDFGTSLREVMKQYAPERILIEPSGVGKVSEVMQAIQDAAEDTDMELNSAVAVVDASKCKLYIKNFGEFFVNQIEYAGTIILTRTDKVSDAKIAECVEILREHNSKAAIITTPIAELDGKQILATIEGKSDLQAEILAEVMNEHDDDEDEHEHHHHHHDDDDEDEHEHHHHHHDDDDDDDDDEHEHHHHHHDDDDDDEEMTTRMSMSTITTIMTTMMTRMSMSTITTTIMIMITRKWKWMSKATGSTNPTATTIIITTITATTRMRSSRAGEWRLPQSIQRKRSNRFLQNSTIPILTVLSFALKEWFLTDRDTGSTSIMFLKRPKYASAPLMSPARSA